MALEVPHEEWPPLAQPDVTTQNSNHWTAYFSSGGRFPVTRIGQTDYLHVLADTKLADVRFPKEIVTIRLPEPSDGRLRLAKLKEVIAFVKRKARS